MKKFIVRLVIALVVLFIIAFMAVRLFLDRAVKAAIETIGPKVTGVEVKLQDVSVSLLSGSGNLKGLVIGNPPGFKTPWAINVGSASLALEPRSLLSDKIVIKSINLQAPAITLETDLRSDNLGKILANVEGGGGGGGQTAAKPAEAAPPKAAKASKKLQVDDFVITGGKIYVSVSTLGGQSATVPLPDIHLQDLGKGPEGITAAELTQRILAAIEQASTQAAAGTVADISKGALYMAKDPGKLNTNALGNVTKGLGDLLKKKP
jgi:uncharacterized protein involved in outer membrane biogenesis